MEEANLQAKITTQSPWSWVYAHDPRKTFREESLAQQTFIATYIFLSCVTDLLRKHESCLPKSSVLATMLTKRRCWRLSVQ